MGDARVDVFWISTAVAATQLLAAASPGPNFVVVTSHATGGSRRAGLQVVAGVLAATVLWASSAALGLGAAVASLPGLYAALRFAGAAYLVYLGGRMVLGALRGGARAAAEGVGLATGWPAVRAGFFTNITNPKSVAYYASLFAVMVPPGSPGWLFVAAVLVAALVSALWWVSVALLFSLSPVRRAYERVRRRVDLVAGGVLILLGARLATSK